MRRPPGWASARSAAPESRCVPLGPASFDEQWEGFEFNAWLMGQFELTRFSPAYVLAGVVMLFLLSQAATLAPALRAARIATVGAIRSP